MNINSIHDGYIYDNNVILQNKDIYGNILALNYVGNNYEIHFIELYHKNFDEYDYRDKILDIDTDYNNVVSKYKKLFEIWSDPKIISLEKYI